MENSIESYYRRSVLNREFSKSFRGETASAAIGNVVNGIEFFGITKGQFSVIDIIVHCLEFTGPSDVSISTWSAAAADIDILSRFLTNGNLKSVRFLIDHSVKSRKPAIPLQIIDQFGSDSLRITSIHAKSVIITNDDWNIVIITSMNLNFNPRFEYFSISDDKGFAGWLLETFDDIWSNLDASQCIKQSRIGDRAGFRSYSSGDQDVMVRKSQYGIFF